MGKLDGKVAIITGAARGIGAAATRLFVAESAKVMMADVLADNLTGLAAELGDSVGVCQTDVTDEAQVKNLVAQTIAEFGKLDIALLNAGIEGALAHPTEYDTYMFDNVIAVNVRGVFPGSEAHHGPYEGKRRLHRHYRLDRRHPGRARHGRLCCL